MGIVKAEQVSGSSARIDKSGNRTYVNCYMVETDNRFQSPKSVDAACGGIYYVSQQPDDLQCYLCDKDIVQRTDEPFIWDVRYTYTSAEIKQLTGHSPLAPSGGTPPDPHTKPTEPPTPKGELLPLDQPYMFTWNDGSLTKVLFRDRAGQPVVSSAGQPFANGIEVTETNPELTVTFNSADFDPEDQYNYLGAINGAEFLGAPAYAVRCSGWSGTSKFEKGLWYWAKTVKLSFLFGEPTGLGDRTGGWAPFKVLDAGTMQAGGTGEKKLKPIPQPGVPGQVVTEPVPLNGSGAPLPQGSTDFHYQTFQKYRIVDFTNIIT